MQACMRIVSGTLTNSHSAHVMYFCCEKWAPLYPKLHKRYHLEEPKTSVFQSNSKRKNQQRRLLAIESYLGSLLPIACLRPFLAHFLQVPASALAGLQAEASSAEARERAERRLLIAMGLSAAHAASNDEHERHYMPVVVPSGLGVSELPRKGNTDTASRQALQQSHSFRKQNRRLFEKLMPRMLSNAQRQGSHEANNTSSRHPPLHQAEAEAEAAAVAEAEAQLQAQPRESSLSPPSALLPPRLLVRTSGSSSSNPQQHVSEDRKSLQSDAAGSAPQLQQPRSRGPPVLPPARHRR